jgi:hypothetical protein
VSLLLNLLGWVLRLFLKQTPPPSQEAVQAKEAGAAETALKTEEHSNVVVLQAAAARDDAVRSVSADDGLRQYEQHDPNNRDGAA